MELLLRVQAAGAPASAIDVMVTADPGHTIEELVAALRPWIAVSETTALVALPEGRHLQPSARLDEVGLVSGDHLEFRTEVPPPVPEAGSGPSLFLEVIGGPGEGLSKRLVPGVYELGRPRNRVGQGPTYLPIENRGASDGHLTLVVDVDLRVKVTEREGVKNPVRIGGAPRAGTFRLDPGTKLDLADSIIELRLVKPRRSLVTDQLGQVSFHRTPHQPSRPIEVELPAIAKVPTRPEPTPFSWLSTLVPILGGVVMAVALQEPRFLFFTLLAPLTGGASFIEGRKRGRVAYARELAAFNTRFDARRSAYLEAKEKETDARHEASPDLAALRRRAESRSKDLWCRGRTLPEFLSLKVGIGDVPALVSHGRDGDGDDEHLLRLEKLAEEFARIESVPVLLDLADLGAAAIVGNVVEVRSSAQSLLLQAVCLHSPEDLVVAAASTGQLGITDWLKWLPHTRTTGSPITGPHLAGDTASANELLRSIIDVVEFRVASSANGIDRRWPWILVVLDRLMEADSRLVSQVLAGAPDAGLSVLWLSDTSDRVPPDCQAVVELRPRNVAGADRSIVWYSEPGRRRQRFVSDGVDVDLPDTVGRSLAPLRDASAATATASIPRVVSLFEAHQIEAVTKAWLEAQWAIDRRGPAGGYAIQTVIGLRDDGPMQLDLVEDGPHGLIGGTSGAGKSELLQAFVAGLIISHPPTDLNLLFIDFKGGSASEVFKKVPHLAGRVTDLDESLALRAQVSLRAELRSRVELFSSVGAKDMADMRRDHPAIAPPSLVIVIDEFATLVKQLPDFVAEIIDIAQRGRSYGVHLVLATQRPSAAVDDNILANTNLRISLRMLDRAESMSVLNAPEAADIPVPLKGRAIARMGPGQLVEFQSAYCSSPRLADGGRRPVVVEPFAAITNRVASKATPAEAPRKVETQLDELIGCVVDMGRPTTVQVWNELLPSHLTLTAAAQLANDEVPPRTLAPGRLVLLGGTDDPARQTRYPTVVDLDAGGGLLVFGAGDSGKTSVLRTIAVSSAIDDDAFGGGGLAIYVLDFASGELRSLRALPQCIGVGTLDDLEAATRILEVLAAEVEWRRAGLADSAAARPTAPTILLLVDGYPSIVDALVNPSLGQEQASDRWFSQLQRILIDGRQVGIHSVVTADRAASVRNAILAGITSKLILRQVDDAEARALGAPPTRTMAPGGGYLDGMRVQVAALRALETDSEGDTLTSIATRLAARSRTGPADRALASDLPRPASRPRPHRGHLGRADIDATSVPFDLTSLDLLVTGPPQSGKSEALLSIGLQLVEAGHDVYVIGAEDSGIRDHDWSVAAWGGAEIDQALGAMAAQLSYPGRGAILLADDIDLIRHSTFDAAAAPLGALRSLRVVASTASFGYTNNELAKRARAARQVLYLQPSNSREVAEVVGLTRLPNLRLGLAFPPGRGVLVVRGTSTVLQTYRSGVERHTSHDQGEDDRAEPLGR